MTVSIVTQTSVRPERSEDFARWQGETSNMVSSFPGFVEQRLMPPNPPLQVDWVILQRFHSMEDAQRWLASPERQTRIEGAAPFLVGRDDVHIVRDDEGGRKPAPVSAVISTRVKPGKDAEYRVWERKIAAAQSKAPGLQGYRFEPPVPGVQEDYVAILRFDNQTNLQAWLDSPVRKQLVEEARHKIKTIPVEEAIRRHGDPDVVFVDIRDVRELERDGMIPGAFHAPRGRASSDVEENLRRLEGLVARRATSWETRGCLVSSRSTAASRTRPR